MKIYFKNFIFCWSQRRLLNFYIVQDGVSIIILFRLISCLSFLLSQTKRNLKKENMVGINLDIWMYSELETKVSCHTLTTQTVLYHFYVVVIFLIFYYGLYDILNVSLIFCLILIWHLTCSQHNLVSNYVMTYYEWLSFFCTGDSLFCKLIPKWLYTR